MRLTTRFSLNSSEIRLDGGNKDEKLSDAQNIHGYALSEAASEPESFQIDMPHAQKPISCLPI
jgi:hypothetical protein